VSRQVGQTGLNGLASDNFNGIPKETHNNVVRALVILRKITCQLNPMSQC